MHRTSRLGLNRCRRTSDAITNKQAEIAGPIRGDRGNRNPFPSKLGHTKGGEFAKRRGVPQTTSYVPEPAIPAIKITELNCNQITQIRPCKKSRTCLPVPPKPI